MLNFSRCALFAAVLLAAGPAAAAAQGATAIPVESFMKPAAVEHAEVSPSGRYAAVSELAADGRRQLKVVDVDEKEPPRIVAKFQRMDISWFKWLSDDWLVMGTSDESNRHGLVSGDVAAVKRDGSGLRQLISGTGYGSGRALGPEFYLVGYGPPGANEIIVGRFEAERTGRELSHSLLSIQNVETGAVRAMFKDRPAPPVKVKDWYIDPAGYPRMAATHSGPDTVIYWADPKTSQWRKLAQFPTIRPHFTPQFVDDQLQLYVSVNNSTTGLAEIRKFDFSTGKPGDEVILSLPGFDADNIVPTMDRGSGKLHGLQVLADSWSVAWFNQQMAGLQREIDRMLPGRVNKVSCHPCSAPKTLHIFSYADNEPGSHLLFRMADGKLMRLAEVRPGLPSAQLARMELYRTTAADGAGLPVWITQTETPVAGPRPAVVLVHGGPWTRGSEWKFRPDAQFLATRGYVVIEPEFRGGKGFGDKHYRAGWKQWGQLMQDDLADAVSFAVKKGWVDPARVCIAGESYGGYATLMGLARHPGLYKCGVAWSAVTDPRMLFTVHWSDTSEFSKEHLLPFTVGDLEKDAAMLKAHAPIELAARIRAPLLLAHGELDEQVPIVHGKKMRDALKDAGNPPEWIVYDNEGHHWSRTANRIDFWRKVEAFLGRHLK